jgi:HD-like signal output (HDOD) protein
MANSAALARRTATRTLEDAVMALGLRKTCDILVGVCARQLYVGPNALVRDLWDHAVTVGVAAEELAVFTRRVDAGLAFLPGLFHDVGRIAFLLADAPTFEVVHAVATNGVEPAIEVERQWYGFHHGECGAVLVEDWGLTLAQADAIRWHHDPVTAAKEAANPVDALAAIVAAADALAHRLAADDTAGADGALCTALGLSTDDETTCLDRIRASLAAYRELLG